MYETIILAICFHADAIHLQGKFTSASSPDSERAHCSCRTTALGRGQMEAQKWIAE